MTAAQKSHPSASFHEGSPVDALVDEVGRQADLPVGPESEILVEALQERLGSSLLGVLLYGSGLHHGNLTEGLVDLYAIVDSYRSAYSTRVLRLGNAMLGPNVFYLDASGHTPPLAAKYAVMSLDHFERGCTRWFHPYIWARFAQPARLVYSRDEATSGRIIQALAQAVVKFLSEATAACDAEIVDSETLWLSGLSRAYSSELRAEKNRERVLMQVNAGRFDRLTEYAAPALSPSLISLGDGRYRSGADASARRRAHRRWRLRRWQGRVLSILRLTKAAFTFDRGADYLAWKIERHTGVAIPVTPTLRRHPILFGPKVLWRLIRGGTVR
jgi:hypothetical protein